MHQPRIFHLIQRAHSALFRASDRALRAHIGLTASQQAVLFVLMIRDGRPISEIANELNMGKSSLTGLIDRMETAGMVERRHHQEDGRSFKVFIKDRGRAAADGAMRGTKRINAELLAPFTATERAVIEKFLRHVSDNAASIVDAQSQVSFKEKVSP
ncbi:MAG: MarR family winged helix-turn-helix transcriptional regulator [Pseudomonadota bacterium]